MAGNEGGLHRFDDVEVDPVAYGIRRDGATKGISRGWCWPTIERLQGGPQRSQRFVAQRQLR